MSKMIEMRLCETKFLCLKPNVHYIFTVDVTCASCLRTALEALGETEKKNEVHIEKAKCPWCGGTDKPLRRKDCMDMPCGHEFHKKGETK